MYNEIKTRLTFTVKTNWSERALYTLIEQHIVYLHVMWYKLWINSISSKPFPKLVVSKLLHQEIFLWCSSSSYMYICVLFHLDLAFIKNGERLRVQVSSRDSVWHLFTGLGVFSPSPPPSGKSPQGEALFTKQQ